MSSAGLVFAAPVLRLSNTVAIVQVSVGASPPVLTLEAYNAGDGTLSPGLSVPPEVPWLTASVGGACPPGSPLEHVEPLARGGARNDLPHGADVGQGQAARFAQLLLDRSAHQVRTLGLPELIVVAVVPLVALFGWLIFRPGGRRSDN